MNQPSPALDEMVRTMQIIAGALIAGVLLFALISVVAIGALSQDSSGTVVSLVGVFLAVAALVMHRVVPSAIEQQARQGASRRLSVDQLAGLFRTRLIVGLAILEGAAMLNVVALIIEHNWWSLGITGLLVFWMLAAFPTRTRVDHWIETQQMLMS